MMTSKENTSESGFSLLEVVIAMSILAIGLLGVAALQITAIQGSAYGMNLSRTNAIVSNKFEELRLKSYTSYSDIKTEKMQEGPYTIETTVTDGVPVSSTKGVLITISWKDNASKKTYSIKYQTFLSDKTSAH